MIKTKYLKLGIVLTYVMLPISGFAFLPVIDPTAVYNLIRQLKTLDNEYTEMQKQYESAQNRLNEAKALRSDSEGHYGYGNLYNDQQYTVKREWSPDNWQDVLKGLSGGNPARYQQLISQYQSDNPTMSQSDYAKGGSADNAQIYQAQIQNNQAASVTSTYAFNNIKDHIEHIQSLSQQIESATNEKSAIDLNTRMAAQIAYVQVEILKQNALMNEQAAHKNEDQIRYETASAKFNRLPDE